MFNFYNRYKRLFDFYVLFLRKFIFIFYIAKFHTLTSNIAAMNTNHKQLTIFITS